MWYTVLSEARREIFYISVSDVSSVRSFEFIYSVWIKYDRSAGCAVPTSEMVFKEKNKLQKDF